MNTGTITRANKHETLAPDDAVDRAFLEAIQDPEKRKEVIAILVRAGLIPG